MEKLKFYPILTSQAIAALVNALWIGLTGAEEPMSEEVVAAIVILVQFAAGFVAQQFTRSKASLQLPRGRDRFDA